MGETGAGRNEPSGDADEEEGGAPGEVRRSRG